MLTQTSVPHIFSTKTGNGIRKLEYRTPKRHEIIKGLVRTDLKRIDHFVLVNHFALNTLSGTKLLRH